MFSRRFRHARRRRKGAVRKGGNGKWGKGKGGETGKRGKGKALGLGPGFATSGSFLHFTPPIAYSKRLFVAVSLSLHELILLLLLLPNE